MNKPTYYHDDGTTHEMADVRDYALPPEGQFCPYCDRRMSTREATEQHTCDDCYAGYRV